jgi:hypothetical protein
MHVNLMVIERSFADIEEDSINAPISRIKVLDVYRRQLAWTGGSGLSWVSWLFMDAFLSDLTRPDPLNPNDRKSNLKKVIYPLCAKCLVTWECIKTSPCEIIICHKGMVYRSSFGVYYSDRVA